MKGSVGWGQRSLVHAAAEDDEVARAAPRRKGRQLLAANAEAGVLRPPRARGAHAVHGLHRPRALLRLGLSATMPLPLASEGRNADVMSASIGGVVTVWLPGNRRMALFRVSVR